MYLQNNLISKNDHNTTNKNIKQQTKRTFKIEVWQQTRIYLCLSNPLTMITFGTFRVLKLYRKWRLSGKHAQT